MYIPKVKQPHIPSYKGIMDENKFISWLSRKEGILLDEPQERLSSEHTEECNGCAKCEE